MILISKIITICIFLQSCLSQSLDVCNNITDTPPEYPFILDTHDTEISLKCSYTSGSFTQYVSQENIALEWYRNGERIINATTVINGAEVTVRLQLNGKTVDGNLSITLRQNTVKQRALIEGNFTCKCSSSNKKGNSILIVLPQLNESLQRVHLIDIGQEEATTATISSQIELGANRLHQVYITEWFDESDHLLVRYPPDEPPYSLPLCGGGRYCIDENLDLQIRNVTYREQAFKQTVRLLAEGNKPPYQISSKVKLIPYIQPKIKDQPSQPSHKYIILSGSNSNFSPLNYTTTVYPHSYFNAKWLLNGTVVQQDTFIPMNATTVRDSFSQQVLNHDQISQTKELTIFNVTYSAVLRIPGDGPVTKDVYSEDNRTVLYHVLPFDETDFTVTYECLENQKNEIKMRIKYLKQIPVQFPFKVWFSVIREGETKRYSRIGENGADIQTEIYELDESVSSGSRLQTTIVFSSDNQEVRVGSTYKEYEDIGSCVVATLQIIIISTSVTVTVLLLFVIIIIIIIACCCRYRQRRSNSPATDGPTQYVVPNPPPYFHNHLVHSNLNPMEPLSVISFPTSMYSGSNPSLGHPPAVYVSNADYEPKRPSRGLQRQVWSHSTLPATEHELTPINEQPMWSSLARQKSLSDNQINNHANRQRLPTEPDYDVPTFSGRRRRESSCSHPLQPNQCCHHVLNERNAPPERFCHIPVSRIGSSSTSATGSMRSDNPLIPSSNGTSDDEQPFTQTRNSINFRSN